MFHINLKELYTNWLQGPSNHDALFVSKPNHQSFAFRVLCRFNRLHRKSRTSLSHRSRLPHICPSYPLLRRHLQHPGMHPRRHKKLLRRSSRHRRQRNLPQRATNMQPTRPMDTLPRPTNTRTRNLRQNRQQLRRANRRTTQANRQRLV